VRRCEQTAGSRSGTTLIWGWMTNCRGRPIEGKCGHPKKKRTAEKLRAWRASLLRSRAHLLGVYAPDEKSAEAAAIAEFKIGEDQRRRLVVRKQD